MPKLESLVLLGRRGFSSFHYVESFELSDGALQEVFIDNDVLPLLKRFHLASRCELRG